MKEITLPPAPMGWKLERLFVFLFELQKRRNHSKTHITTRRMIHRKTAIGENCDLEEQETVKCDKIIARWCKVICRDQRPNPMGHGSAR
ncbi:hypothetical protein AVEN_223273-1 [Araneus ventricosus]|uniref:Uncharacterized protein n=1 Tax=Araneus ventricosus TaxID=182803 RepID=A0A4Y2BFQ3_ARAVE|nr:hypothetical protein AVEN_223273-1 [Araneus ventricosus]